MNFHDYQPTPLGDGKPALAIEASVRQPDGHGHITLTGELDRDTVDSLRETVERLMQDACPPTVRLDLGDVAFLDAAGGRGLIDCHRIVTRHGSTLTVHQVQPIVRRVLTIIGASPTLGLPTLAGATARIGPRRPTRLPALDLPDLAPTQPATHPAPGPAGADAPVLTDRTLALRRLHAQSAALQQSALKIMARSAELLRAR